MQKPSAEPSPEQTASILSLAVFRFLDPVVFLAYSIPHLSFDQLPPLADYDVAENLRAKAFRVGSSPSYTLHCHSSYLSSNST